MKGAITPISPPTRPRASPAPSAPRARPASGSRASRRRGRARCRRSLARGTPARRSGGSTGRCAASSATRRSVAVRSAGARGRSPIRASSADARSAHSGRAQRLEDRQGLAELPVGQPLLLAPPVDLALREQRSAALERHRQAVVLDDGSIERREGGIEVARRRLDEPAPAGPDRERPGRRRHAGDVLEEADDRTRPLEVAHADRGLEPVAVHLEPARVARPACLGQRPGDRQLLVGRAGDRRARAR